MARRKANSEPEDASQKPALSAQSPRPRKAAISASSSEIDEFYRVPLTSGEAIAVLAFLRALEKPLSTLPQSVLDPAILQSAAERLAAQLPEFAADNAAHLAKTLRQTLSSALNDMGKEGVQASETGLSIREKVTALELAMESGSPVEIRYYVASRDEWTRRLVDIDDVYEDEGKWYCEGYCRLRRDHRVFRVDNIGSVRLRDNGVS